MSLSYRLLRAPAVVAAVVVAAGLAVASGRARADADQDAERARLEEKRGELADRLARVETVAATHGAYVRLRDGDFLGDDGLASRATAFFDEASGWIKDWRLTLSLLDRVSDLAAPQARRDLLKRIHDSEAAFQTLRAHAYDLASRSARLEANVGALTELGRTTTPAYADQTEALDRQKAKLREATKTAALGGPALLQRWAEISSLSERLVRQRIGQALGKSPELDEALRQVEEMYRADRVAAPLVADVYAAYDVLRSAINAYRPFAADEAKAIFTTKVATARQKIGEAKLDPAFAKAPLDDITRWENTALGLYDEAIAPYPPSFLVGTYFSDTGPKVASKCRDGAQRLQVNCELFQRVFTVSRDRIDTMTDEELRYLEASIDKVQKPASVPVER